MLKSPRNKLAPALLPLAIATLLSMPLPTLATGETTRVSVATDGSQGNNWSGVYYAYNSYVSVSADSRYVVFTSAASNLVPNDTNDTRNSDVHDLFVRDRLTKVTTRVNVTNDGSEGVYGVTKLGAGRSRHSISSDGRYVAFSSPDPLVPGDIVDGATDVFVRDLQKGTTSRVSVASDGTPGLGHSFSPAISADGRYVAFQSYADNLTPNDTWLPDIFIRDQQTGITSRVSIASNGTQSNHYSKCPSISADGRYVAFVSYASNLVSGDTNGKPDVFVRDRQAATTTRVSVASDGTQGNYYSSRMNCPAISSNGRYVAFISGASNLIPNDTNNQPDVFLRDLKTSTTVRVSVTSNGTEANFGSDYYGIAISADGRYVAFSSGSNNLVSNDTNGISDVFVRDQQAKTTIRINVTTAGDQAKPFGFSYAVGPAISADGRYVAFSSDVPLVPEDSNGGGDVFVRDTLQTNTSADLTVTQTESADPAIKGQPLTYTVTAKNLSAKKATSVTLTDLLPSSARLVSVKPSQGKCAASAVTVCRLGTLAAGASATVAVTVKPTAKGSVTNQATVSAAPKDPAPNNNSSVATTQVQ